eukprot:6173383-Alexandrium_andersonii.AAC.1
MLPPPKGDHPSAAGAKPVAHPGPAAELAAAAVPVCTGACGPAPTGADGAHEGAAGQLAVVRVHACGGAAAEAAGPPKGLRPGGGAA